MAKQPRTVPDSGTVSQPNYQEVRSDRDHHRGNARPRRVHPQRSGGVYINNAHVGVHGRVWRPTWTHPLLCPEDHRKHTCSGRPSMLSPVRWVAGNCHLMCADHGRAEPTRNPENPDGNGWRWHISSGTHSVHGSARKWWSDWRSRVTRDVSMGRQRLLPNTVD